MLDIAIIIPAYNEEKTIDIMIRNFHNDCPEAKIWVINNFSSDLTETISNKTLHDLNIPGGVINESIKGKGNAVRSAFTNINADIYVISDADCTYASSDIRQLLKPVIDGNADMVIGDRLSEGKYTKENKRAMQLIIYLALI